MKLPSPSRGGTGWGWGSQGKTHYLNPLPAGARPWDSRAKRSPLPSSSSHPERSASILRRKRRRGLSPPLPHLFFKEAVVLVAPIGGPFRKLLGVGSELFSHDEVYLLIEVEFCGDQSLDLSQYGDLILF